jgi:hypothetical protein
MRAGFLLPGCAALGAAGVAAAWVRCEPARFWANWVLWFLLIFTTALGCLFLVALEHLVGARWSVPLRRVPERLSTLILAAAPMGLLALAGVPALYPEARQTGFATAKALWLGLPCFALRAVLCLGFGLLALVLLVKGSLDQDHHRLPAFTLRARRLAPGFMVLFALVVTVLALDWVGGLTPEWYSDILGVYLFSGTFLAGLGAATLGVLHLRGHSRLEGIRSDHLYSLGGFLFAFTVFWSYLAFAQYLLMWYANLPEEAAWYQDRLQGGWKAVTWALGLFHFAIPFFALVTRRAKSDPGRLRWVAWLALGSHALDLYWLIFPSLGRGVLGSWPELAFALCFLGGSLLWARRSFRWGADMPVGDPCLGLGLEFRL